MLVLPSLLHVELNPSFSKTQNDTPSNSSCPCTDNSYDDDDDHNHEQKELDVNGKDLCLETFVVKDDKYAHTVLQVNNNDDNKQQEQEQPERMPPIVVHTFQRRRRNDDEIKPGTTNSISLSSSRPPPVAPPLRLRRIIDDNAGRQRQRYYGGDGFQLFGLDNRRARLWELQQFEDNAEAEEDEMAPQGTEENHINPHTQNKSKQIRWRTVVSIRRQSELCVFVVSVFAFVAVDDWSLLPAGMLLYYVALTVSWNNWMEELDHDREFLQRLTLRRKKYEQHRLHLDEELQKARFEYHVLKNQPDMEIKVVAMVPTTTDRNVPKTPNRIRNKDDDDAGVYPTTNAKWIIYAEPKRHRRHHR